jgi:hypothetical protein
MVISGIGIAAVAIGAAAVGVLAHAVASISTAQAARRRFMETPCIVLPGLSTRAIGRRG